MHQGKRHLLGSVVTDMRQLTDGTTYIQLEDGRKLIHRNVPRQEQATWQRGTPWTELAVFDVFTDYDVPAPRLRAVDIQAGWLMRDYAEGTPLNKTLPAYDVIQDKADYALFNKLVTGLLNIQDVFAAESTTLQPFAVVPDTAGLRRVAQRIAHFLTPAARNAWDTLTKITLHNEPPHLGPADIQTGNIIVTDDECTFIDMATIQCDWTERRLVAYCQQAIPSLRTLLTPAAYTMYESTFGTEAVRRLALFDFIFWGIVHARLHVVRTAPSSEAARALQAAGVSDSPTIRQAVRAMWERPRLPDPFIERVAGGLAL